VNILALRQVPWIDEITHGPWQNSEGRIEMGDRKPKKNSSGNSDAHKAKKSSDSAQRPPSAPKPGDKPDKK
jgi:hypothetical protein